MLNEEQIWKLVDDKRAEFIALSDRVFETPETLYNEFSSVAEHVLALKAEGFTVTEGICGMPTAVMGEAGTEGPVIAILGEFDALPQLSQAPGVAEHSPIEAGGNGHGCGHNLLGAASLLPEQHSVQPRQHQDRHNVRALNRVYAHEDNSPQYSLTHRHQARFGQDAGPPLHALPCHER